MTNAWRKSTIIWDEKCQLAEQSTERVLTVRFVGVGGRIIVRDKWRRASSGEVDLRSGERHGSRVLYVQVCLNSGLVLVVLPAVYLDKHEGCA